MKKILYIICFFFFSFIFISTVNATSYVNNVFNVSLDCKKNINYDEEIDINVNINVSYNLSVFTGNIKYDNARLELKKCESEFFVCTFNNDKILLDSVEGIDGKQNIATLTFKVLDKSFNCSVFGDVSPSSQFEIVCLVTFIISAKSSCDIFLVFLKL